MRITRLKLKHKTIDDQDAAKRSRLRVKMTRKSLQKRREELSPQKPHKDGPLPPDATVNRAGNRLGMHNAGNSEHMRKVRAMRQFYGPKMPVLQCSNCQISSVCPQYRSGYECAFLPFLKSHRIEDEQDLLDYMKNLLGSNMQRLHLSMLMERASGSAPSLELSEQLSLGFQQLKQLTDLMREDAGEVEFETDDESLIGRIFGNIGALKDVTHSALKDTDDDFIAAEAVEQSEDSVAPAGEHVRAELIKDHERFFDKSDMSRREELPAVIQGGLR